MPEITLSVTEAFQQALMAYEQLRLEDAERLCRALLDVAPDHFDAIELGAKISVRKSQPDATSAPRFTVEYRSRTN